LVGPGRPDHDREFEVKPGAGSVPGAAALAMMK